MRRRPGLLRDRNGTVAVEFALILPLLVTMFFGVVEIANLVLAYMKVASATETIADLVAQQKTVTRSDIDNIVGAGQLVLTPLPTSSFGVAIASVTFDPNTGKPVLAWQDTRNSPAMTSPAPTTLAVGYGEPGSSVVIAKASYTYVSPFTYFLKLPINLSDTAYLRPRQTQAVTHG